ncbi:tRNA (guanosine(37)-N1)-methyltransferase TrmD [Dissulfurirhabdus thermomarina]|uniref:tRNA (guanine-N(1)-)-methyltransferase n=1 Tax=Dissulfurirhabdus thermomarina TaxID=1765737 RepID=A0A6N9TK40_DISTH|nr:tRNA (guanosine(37)-N1)-methyltransferase TrmD [Dissulfurirhabdus thermomarina]NDY41448.1 tRNA (guanosine(37)-N1)-methyltransferase TrmD [Dissulfurirhabdus thermomarina]NMX24270.1 tRNA (guanosine(37)-N1)-methyltransferase TrmD [Dissulfurirhabdus thermomarina]
MRFDILTIFPGFFDSPLRESLLGKALAAGHLDVRVVDLRGFTDDRHRTTDDRPYGGGEGMVMKPGPLFRAIEALRAEPPPPRVVLFTPRGRLLDQPLVEEMARWERIVLVCGRYEGVDERVHRHAADLEVSVGDYVLAGGETAALAVVEAVSRLLPGVLGCAASARRDSFSDGLLEYPQYTRPADFRGWRVPEVLLSGDHERIRRWRRECALRLTLERRPDLLAKADLDAADRAFLRRLGWNGTE